MASARTSPIPTKIAKVSRSVILSCAVTGSAPTSGINPAVPVTPQQIADSAASAAIAGASIVHIHVRDPETAQPSSDFSLYEEVVNRIHDSGVPVLINLTTGPGARFVHKLETPAEAAPGTTLCAYQERIDHVLRLKPELCSLDFATMNRQGFSYINLPDHLRQMLISVQDAGVKPELEVFDSGNLELLRDILAEVETARPRFIQFCLGLKWGMPATKEAVAYLVSRLPEDTVWAAFGIGKSGQKISQLALEMGGHLRVGFEDNIYLRRGVLAESNAQLVKQAASLIEENGHRVASVNETREILQITSKKLHLGETSDFSWVTSRSM